MKTLVVDEHDKEGAVNYAARSPGFHQGTTSVLFSREKAHLRGWVGAMKSQRQREKSRFISKGPFYCKCSVFFNPVEIKCFSLFKIHDVSKKEGSCWPPVSPRLMQLAQM